MYGHNYAPPSGRARTPRQEKHVLNTNGIVTEAVKMLVPLACLFIGLGIIFSAKKGRISDAASTLTLVLIGLVVIAAGGVMYGFADEIADLIFA